MSDDVRSPMTRRQKWFGAAWLAALAVSAVLAVRIHSIVEVQAEPIANSLPQHVDGWELLPEGGLQVVNPQQAETLKEIYDENISRSYRLKSTGEVVMLAIAYGRDQSRKSQVHKPEVCYPAQGFQLRKVWKTDIRAGGRSVPVTRLTAEQGARIEHIQYWILQGDRIIRGALQQNLYRAKRAIEGERTDGLLFRTSVITDDANRAFALQQQFIDQLLTGVPRSKVARLLGAVPANAEVAAR